MKNALAAAVRTAVGVAACVAIAPPVSADSTPPDEQSPPRVMDRYDKFVGWPGARVSSPVGSASSPQPVNVVLRKVNGTWVAIPADVRGFVTATALVANAVYLYTTTNCTGQAYVNATELPPVGWIVERGTPKRQVLLYPGEPFQLLVARSAMLATRPYSASCATIGESTLRLGPVQSVYVDSFGLSPPFSVR